MTSTELTNDMQSLVAAAVNALRRHGSRSRTNATYSGKHFYISGEYRPKRETKPGHQEFPRRVTVSRPISQWYSRRRVTGPLLHIEMDADGSFKVPKCKRGVWQRELMRLAGGSQ